MNRRQKKKKAVLKAKPGVGVRVCLDFSAFSDRSDFHRMLHAQKAFPDYEGNNLDALFDMLTEISKPVTVELLNLDGWSGAAESYKTNIRKLFKRAEEENPNVKLEIG